MNPHYSEDVNEKNEKSLQTLVRAIRLSHGEFSLILVRCNYTELRDRMRQRLRQISPVQIKEITLTASAKTLYSTILAELEDENPSALMVFGLESVTEINKVLTSSKYVREEFRKNFTFPMLLWVNDRVLQKLNRLATDFANWATRIEFTLTTDELIDFLHQKTDEIFTNDANLNPKTCYELETARKNLQNCGQVLQPVVEAGLEFVIGLNYYLYNQIDFALEHYELSLTFWQQSHHLERQGILLLHIALAYYRKAKQNHLEKQRYEQESRNYLQQCIDIFEKAQRPDLVAKYISKLGEVLRCFKGWKELNNFAKQSLKLHQNYGNPQQIAQDYGFLAEAALGRLRWNEAKQLAKQALQTLADIPNLKSDYQGLYLFILASAEQRLGQIEEAISNLETAIAIQDSHKQYDPQLYISISENLHSLYFEQGKYLEAFQVKQQKIQIEHKYGFRAFAGVNYLNSQQQIINVVPLVENHRIITPTINVPGREEDVKRLIKKISSTEYKLIVLHGQSGVGKSSLLLVGLIPTLQQQTIDGRVTLPILLRVYTDWIGMLMQSLTEAFEEVKGNKSSVNLDSIEGILKHLRKNADSNLLTVLIFDQFEEFFFVYKNSKKRQLFYEFLDGCLNIPYVKVILSLQEDYLHYLLEWERLPNTPVINKDILTLRNRYYLANFSIHDAKVVIQTLIEKSHFFLENLLIDEFVGDLASETGEVRPIELQILGTQLQTDKITTLQQYHQFGKKKLVQRFLEELLRDCGLGNEGTAKSVLYSLINSNAPRPIKTYIELQENLSLELDKLDLVLDILVKSGLISLLPKLGIKRYQLVHEYLVELIRGAIEFPIREEILGSKINNSQSLPIINKDEFIATQLGGAFALKSTDRRSKNLNIKFKLTKLNSIIIFIFIFIQKTIFFIIATLSITTIVLLIFSILPLSQDQFALKVLIFGGWGVAAYTAYKIYQDKKQREKIILQIKEQNDNILLLQALLREGRNYPTQTPTAISECSPDVRVLNNRYRTTDVLGCGGFSYTYLAEDTHHPSKLMCVVKHLQPARTDEGFLEIARRLFKTEAEILALLGHHNQIPQLMAYFEENKQFYLVQEYIKGHSLNEELTPGQRFSEAEVIDFLKDILSVLVFVHNHGVIHRDIKPSNLMRRQKDNRIVLIDFGAVKQIEPQQLYENPTVAVGTAGYAPPEQFMGLPRLNSDIYALGMVAIQALTGASPRHFERNETMALLWRSSTTSEPLAAILDKMVSYYFDQRYQSAEEVLQSLDLIK